MRVISAQDLDHAIRHQKIALTVLGLGGLGIIASYSQQFPMAEINSSVLQWAMVGTSGLSAWAAFRWWQLFRRRRRYNLSRNILSDAKSDCGLLGLRRCVEHLQEARQQDALIEALVRNEIEALQEKLENAENLNAQFQRKQALKRQFAKLEREIGSRFQTYRSREDVQRARNAATYALAQAKDQKEQLKLSVDRHVSNLSWWGQLTFEHPDYRAMDKDIKKLEGQVRTFLRKSEAVARENAKALDRAEARALARIDQARSIAFDAVPLRKDRKFNSEALAPQAVVLGLMSIPISIWSDVAQAGEVFDVLRDVNGNFAELSDAEIWWRCVSMPAESLAGLSSLTKGALFEAHVADTTGGTLHEFFNTPDTDIVIDGEAYQTKATDSVSYVESVDPDIPVIATTEVAGVTFAIDGGLSNLELTDTTDLALGGSVVDMGDTAVDAVFTSFGALGILATCRGINHAASRIGEGIDGFEAICEGIGVAVTGTAKATVDLAEMGYKVATSRPSRFVGRQVARGMGAVGRRLMGSEDQAEHPDPAKRS